MRRGGTSHKNWAWNFPDYIVEPEKITVKVDKFVMLNAEENSDEFE